MSSIEVKTIYRCDNDCHMEGCPGHEAKLSYQSTSDWLTFQGGRHEFLALDLNLLEAFLKLLADISYRAEISGAIERAGLKVSNSEGAK